MLVPRYKLFLCHTPIKLDLLGFSGIGVFVCGLHDHMITRFASYVLVLKTTITNIINALYKIPIISLPWPFSPTAFVYFWFSPNLPHVLRVCISLVTISLTLSSLSDTFPITKFILSIICFMACIWILSSPSGGGGVLF